MHLSNTMLDVLGTAPVEAVIHLHLEPRAAYAQQGRILPSYVKLHARGSVDARADAGTGMRFAYLVFTGGVLPSSWQTSVLREKCSSLRS